jgi:hypothetical protein
MIERTNKGCLYWDESSRGVKNGKQDRRGRWCAEKRIDGRLVRKRSSDMQKCLDFLNDCDTIEERKPQRTVEVPTLHDRRFMVYKGNLASMEQRKQILSDRIKESEMTLRYFETRDFTEINRYIEKIILPRLNVYCVERLHISKDMRTVILQCVAILYTYIYADVPVFCYEWKLRAMLRYWLEHGDLGYYEKMPEPVHEAVDALDVSALEKRFVVKRRN